MPTNLMPTNLTPTNFMQVITDISAMQSADIPFKSWYETMSLNALLQIN